MRVWGVDSLEFYKEETVTGYSYFTQTVSTYRNRFYFRSDALPIYTNYFSNPYSHIRGFAYLYPSPQNVCDVYSQYYGTDKMFFIPNSRETGEVGICKERRSDGSIVGIFSVFRAVTCPHGYGYPASQDYRVWAQLWPSSFTASTSTEIDAELKKLGDSPYYFDVPGHVDDIICRDSNKIGISYFNNPYRSVWGHPIEVHKTDKCPVTELTPPEKLVTAYSTDPVEMQNTLSLEKNLGNNGYSFLTPSTQQAEQCLKGKVANLQVPVPWQMPIPYLLSSTYRTKAYQDHLLEIWNKMDKLVKLETKFPEKAKLCTTRRAEIAAKKGCNNAGGCKSCTAGSHCLVYPPAEFDPKHVSGTAFDVNQVTMSAVLAGLGDKRPPQTTQAFVDEPEKCNLGWGGDFLGEEKDRVHFYLK